MDSSYIHRTEVKREREIESIILRSNIKKIFEYVSSLCDIVIDKKISSGYRVGKRV